MFTLFKRCQTSRVCYIPDIFSIYALGRSMAGDSLIHGRYQEEKQIKCFHKNSKLKRKTIDL
jgi:hypothetical protein